MASGVKVHDSVKDTWNQVSMKSSKSTKLKYAIFTFSDDLKQIVVERSGTKEEDGWQYDALISALPPNDVRYVAYDFEFVSCDDSKTSKMVLVNWHPETSSIKKKMLVSSSFNALKTCLNVSSNAYEGDALAEINSQAILEKLNGKISEN